MKEKKYIFSAIFWGDGPLKGVKAVCDVHILFDSGSDRSYVTTRLTKRIKPTLTGREYVSYTAFGETKANSNKLSKLYQLKLIGKDSKGYILQALETDIICKPLYRPKIPAEILAAFGSLKLADSYSENREISIEVLVGLDFYWQFINPSTAVIKQGLVALQSPFGWIISGKASNDPLLQTQLIDTHTQLLCLSQVNDEHLKRFWEIECFAVSDNESKNLESSRIYQSFQNSLERVNGR